MTELPSQSVSPTTPQSVAPPAHKRSSLKKKRWWTLALAVLVLAWAILTHSRVTRHLVIPRLEALLNASIEGGEVSVGLNGVVRITDATLRAPGIDGQAGAVLELKRLKARPNWGRLLGISSSSTSLVSRVELTEPTARLSLSVDDKSLNFAAIKLPSPQGGSAEVPEIVVRRGRLELGEHRTVNGVTTYTLLKRIEIDGTFKPAANLEKGVYEIALTQIMGKPNAAEPEPASASLVDIRGTVGADGVSLSMKGLTLEDWPASSIPTPLRDVFAFMNLQGRIRQTDVVYDEASGVRATLELDEVAVNLPVLATDNPLEGPVQPAPPMRMSRVNGWIRVDRNGAVADLRGQLEDLPYKVMLNYSGTTADAAFTCDFECENFTIEEKPQILRFVPPTVRYRLATFSNPTAVVSAKAHVTRGPAVNGLPGEVKVAGTLDFHGGVAAYERFPYQFRELSGSVRFDESTIDILRVEGVAPTGARVKARVHISPINDAAGVDVYVEAVGVPIDSTLEAAMGAGRKKLVTEITSRGQYERLISEGVIVSPERSIEAARELMAVKAELSTASLERARQLESRARELERQVATPVFALGGTGDVVLKINRAVGIEPVWTETIDIKLGTIGVLPDRFPLPVRASNVNIFIDGETVTVRGGTYQGISGGSATVAATMKYPSYESPDTDPLPQISVRASGIPTDDRLISAISGAVRRAARANSGAGQNAAADGQPVPEANDAWVRRVLTGLGLHGQIDATADIASNELGTSVDALARVENATSTPISLSKGGAGVEPAAASVVVSASRNVPSEPLIDRISGMVHVTDQIVSIDLAGRLGARDGDPDMQIKAELAARDPDPEFVGPPPPYRWTALLDAPRYKTPLLVEPLLALFSSEVSSKIAELREQFKPAGLTDLSAVIAGGGPLGTRATVELSTLDGIELDIFGDRLSVTESQGIARVLGGGSTPGISLEFEGFRAEAYYRDEHAGTLAVDGRISDLGEGPKADPLSEQGELTVGLMNARFESLLTEHTIRDRAGQGIRDFVAKGQPTGGYDVWISPRKTSAGDWVVRGTLSPRSLALNLDNGRTSFEAMTGEIEFDGSVGGTFRDIAGESLGDGTPWSFTANGSWLVQSTGTFSLQAQLSAESVGLPRTLLAVVPPEVEQTLKELSATVAGPLVMPKGNLRIDDDGTPGGKAVRFDGSMSIKDLALEVGVPITQADGTLEFTVDSPAHGKPTYEIRSLFDSFKAAKVGMTNGRIRLAGDAKLGQVLVPLISADCYGGRVTGTMQLTTDAASIKRYETSMSFSGIRFAPILNDLGAQQEEPSPAQASSSASLVNPAEDDSRGVMDAHLSLGGTTGDDSTRRGRGSLVIGGGSVLRLPLMLPLVQVSNLQLPTEERLNLAAGDFYVEGPNVVFEDLSVFSESVQIYGYGVVTWPGMDLNLRFNSRSLSRIPLISSLIEAVRDQIISTTITGTLKKPNVNTVPLAGAGDMLSRIFSTPTAEERRMRTIQARAEQARDRVRTTGVRASHTTITAEER